MGGQEVGRISERVSVLCVFLGSGGVRLGVGQTGVEKTGGGSCFDVSIDVLVLGEAGLIR